MSQFVLDDTLPVKETKEKVCRRFVYIRSGVLQVTMCRTVVHCFRTDHLGCYIGAMVCD